MVWAGEDSSRETVSGTERPRLHLPPRVLYDKDCAGQLCSWCCVSEVLAYSFEPLPGVVGEVVGLGVVGEVIGEGREDGLEVLERGRHFGAGTQMLWLPNLY